MSTRRKVNRKSKAQPQARPVLAPSAVQTQRQVTATQAEQAASNAIPAVPGRDLQLTLPELDTTSPYRRQPLEAIESLSDSNNNLATVAQQQLAGLMGSFSMYIQMTAMLLNNWHAAERRILELEAMLGTDPQPVAEAAPAVDTPAPVMPEPVVSTGLRRTSTPATKPTMPEATDSVRRVSPQVAMVVGLREVFANDVFEHGTGDIYKESMNEAGLMLRLDGSLGVNVPEILKQYLANEFEAGVYLVEQDVIGVPQPVLGLLFLTACEMVVIPDTIDYGTGIQAFSVHGEPIALTQAIVDRCNQLVADL